LNIPPSINNSSVNQVNLPIGKNQLEQNRKSISKNDEQQFATDNLKKTKNRSAITPFAFNAKESSTDKTATSQANARSRSTVNINPNLLDKVFKLKSREEQTEVNIHRRSDLYLQTEIISSSEIFEAGIGLDLYV